MAEEHSPLLRWPAMFRVSIIVLDLADHQVVAPMPYRTIKAKKKMKQWSLIYNFLEMVCSGSHVMAC